MGVVTNSSVVFWKLMLRCSFFHFNLSWYPKVLENDNVLEIAYQSTVTLIKMWQNVIFTSLASMDEKNKSEVKLTILLQYHPFFLKVSLKYLKNSAAYLEICVFNTFLDVIILCNIFVQVFKGLNGPFIGWKLA